MIYHQAFNFSVNKNIKLKTPMFRSDFYAYKDTSILLKRTIDLSAAAANENDRAQKDVAFENNTPIRSCISKINNNLLHNGEDLHRVMPVYNLLEYSDQLFYDIKKFV